MSIPTQQELDQRERDAKERLENLKQAYERFVKEWSNIEKQEFDLLRSIHTDVSKLELHDILQKIESINE